MKRRRLPFAVLLIICVLMRSRFIWIVLMLFISGSRSRAQDMVWTELESMGDSRLPAGGVTINGRRAPDVPEEIKKLDEIAYGEVRFIANAKGAGLSREFLATNPWVLKAMDGSVAEAKVATVKPDSADPLFLATRSYLIFNPASAAQNLKNSTPRALSVCSVAYPQRLLDDLNRRKLSESSLPRVIFLKLSIDQAGMVTRAEAAPGAADALLIEAAEGAVKKWKFEPARNERVAVESSIRVPVLFESAKVYSASELSRLPRVIKQVHPVYPISERLGGFSGRVTIQFVVSADGSVRDPFVRESSNINLNASALAAVQAWKFEPGLRNGKPVDSTMAVPMAFNVEGEERERYTVSKKGPDTLPEELKNDYTPTVMNVALGVYPFERLMQNDHAKVKVKFLVNPEGRVKCMDLPNQTLSEFDYAARAMLDQFLFVPASKDGKPNWGLLQMEVAFGPHSVQVPLSDSAEQLQLELKRKEPAIFLLNQADAKPVLITQRAPIYPSNLLDKRPAGETLIEFLVDKEGRAQLPRIISATHPSFGYAACQAISQWQFKPLTHAGKPCIFRVRVPVKFGAPPEL